MPERESSGDIDRAAAGWAARLDRGGLSADENTALEGWLEADVRRRGALARALAVLAQFDEPNGPLDQLARSCGTRRPPG